MSLVGVDGAGMVPGSFNFRDLGGIEVAAGRVRPGAVFRSDLLHRADDEGARMVLRDLGVRSVIDLRLHDERRDDGAFDECEQITVTHVPVLGDVWSWEDEMHATDDLFLRDRTIEMFEDRGHRIVEALVAIADAPPGAVVFHCTAGKDRTGAVAAALLGLLGACPDEIVSDYSRSAAAMPDIVAWFKAQHPERPGDPEIEQRLLERAARPATMAGVVAHIDEAHGGFAAWATAYGLTSDHLDALVGRLVTSE